MYKWEGQFRELYRETAAETASERSHTSWQPVKLTFGAEIIGVLAGHRCEIRAPPTLHTSILEPISDLNLGFPRSSGLQDRSGMVTGIPWVG